LAEQVRALTRTVEELQAEAQRVRSLEAQRVREYATDPLDHGGWW
jgi:hypothetical protein